MRSQVLNFVIIAMLPNEEAEATRMTMVMVAGKIDGGRSHTDDHSGDDC